MKQILLYKQNEKNEKKIDQKKWQWFLMLWSNMGPWRHWISTTQYLILSHIDFDNMQTLLQKKDY